MTSGWTTKKIKNICDLGRGRVISTQEIEANPGVYPVFSSQSYNKGQMGLIDTYDFEGEYITWTTDGAYAGTVFYRNGKFNCTNVCGTLKAKNDLISMPFLAYQLSCHAKQYVSYIGNPKLMNHVMAEIQLSMPDDKNEQTQIAEILYTLDQAIDQIEAIIAKQQRIKIGLIQALLTKGIDDDGNIRSEATHQFKDSPQGRIPVNWDVIPLKNLVNIKHGYAFKGEFFSDQRNENVLLTPGNFHVEGRLYFTENNTKYYLGEIPEEYVLRNGDVLVVMTDLTKEMAILGQTVMLNYTGGSVLHNQRIGKVNIKSDVEMNSDFLPIIMNSRFHRDAVKATATGTTVRHTSPEKILEPFVPKIPINEQNNILNILNKLEQSLHRTRLAHQKNINLKSALMHDLLTGKVRVTELLAAQTNHG